MSHTTLATVTGRNRPSVETAVRRGALQLRIEFDLDLAAWVEVKITKAQLEEALRRIEANAAPPEHPGPAAPSPSPAGPPPPGAAPR